MSKKKKNANKKKPNPWKGWPKYLEREMIAAYFGEISTDVVVESLARELLILDDDASADDVLKRVVWIDRLFCDVMVDTDVHYEAWSSNAVAAGKLLDNAEKLLFELFRSGKAGIRSHVLPTTPQDATALHQRLNAYLCISAIILGDEAEGERRLERVLRDTFSNVSYLLSQEESNELFEEYEDAHGLDFYVPMMHIFTQPLFLLRIFAYEFFEVDKVRPIRDAYARYVRFLETCSLDAKTVRGRLIADAESQYAGLRDWMLEIAKPDLPCYFIDGDEIRKAADEHADLPMAVFVKHGKFWTYAEVTSCTVREVLNANPPYYDESQPLTSRARLKEMVEERLVEEGVDPAVISKAEWDEKVAHALEKYDPRWEKVIAIEVELKEA